MAEPVIAAIRTDFRHHGDHSGYKQVLKYLRPKYLFGLDQNVTAHHENRLYQKYLWLYEFDLWKYRKEIDILFIMYAEEFYRFSWRFMKRAKIVATYHMPPELLRKEIIKGNQRGRVGQITHWLNKKRFSKISAAIVTNVNQKAVLMEVMPEEKIHIIPLGVHLSSLLSVYQSGRSEKKDTGKKNIITTGNWLRDWEFYFKFVKSCPDWNFILINRKLPEEFKGRLQDYPNVSFLQDISDEELHEAVLQADVQFLPLEAIAGSNALLHSLALGCPVVMTNYEAEQFHGNDEIIGLYEKGNVEDCRNELNKRLQLTASEKARVSDAAVAYASQYDWSTVAEKHIELFRKVLES